MFVIFFFIPSANLSYKPLPKIMALVAVFKLGDVFYVSLLFTVNYVRSGDDC